jgi:hypothetical protein
MTKEEDESKFIGAQEDYDLSARRARLRTNLVKQPLDTTKSDLNEVEDNLGNKDIVSEHRKKPSLSEAIQSASKNFSSEQVVGQLEAVALLGHIDKALSSCAGHLASLQKAANQQTEELRAIVETLQTRTANESAQKFNPFMESLTAAIEPMKAIGELVPILDRLANATEIKEEPRKDVSNAMPNQDTGLSEEEREQFLQREENLSKQLLEKEQEVEEIRSQLDGQWNELSSQCEALKMALENSAEILKEKESELNKKITDLSAKDAENLQLKAQMGELKDKTKEMMTDLQKQLAKKHEEELARKDQEESVKKQETENLDKNMQVPLQNAQSGFFDFVSTGNSNNTLFNNSSPTLFNNQPNGIINDETLVANAAPVLQNIQPQSEMNNWQKADGKPNTAGFMADNNQQTISSNSNSVLNPQAMTMSANDAQANTQASASFVSAVGSYGSGVRAQVFEVIVRQALAGTQWREICAVPMQSNNISPQEVETEVKRRQALLKK